MSRIERTQRSLLGLAVGDALGRALVGDRRATAFVERGELPDGPLEYTDDTVMAIPIVRQLIADGTIDQDRLAAIFGQQWLNEPERGYGAVAYWIVAQFAQGKDWRETSREPYSGTGSKGNGGAMRVAPLGAWFANELDQAQRQAALSAEVTHAHPEGQAGAEAVAIAAALAARGPWALADVTALLPASEVRARCQQAEGLNAPEVADQLGRGELILAEDTVPLALTVASAHAGDYAGALREIIALCIDHPDADLDTLAAIVGGIVAAGESGPPRTWVAACEPLPSLA